VADKPSHEWHATVFARKLRNGNTLPYAVHPLLMRGANQPCLSTHVHNRTTKKPNEFIIKSECIIRAGTSASYRLCRDLWIFHLVKNDCSSHTSALKLNFIELRKHGYVCKWQHVNSASFYKESQLLLQHVDCPCQKCPSNSLSDRTCHDRPFCDWIYTFPSVM
jgi:hypothetical protein